MQILWQNEHYPDPVKGGGGAINTYYIVRALNSLGHNTTILARGPTNSEPFTEEVKETKVQRVSPPKMPDKCWPIWPILEPGYTLRSVKAIAAHFDAFVGIDFSFALNVKKLYPGKPLVYRVEGSQRTHDASVASLINGQQADANGKGSSLERLLRLENEFMDRRAWRRSDALVVKSEFMKRELETFYRVPSAKIHVIPNGVDYHRYSIAKPTEDALFRLGSDNDEKTVIVCCGRLVPMKNVSFLLRAFAVMRNRERCVLAIVGDGSERGALEEEAKKLGVASAVRFLGYMSRVEEFLAASDIFVLPSVYEPFGNALIEAMAAGLPCVALKPDARVRTASAEILDHEVTGFLVSGESPTELASLLDILVANQELRGRIGREGQAHCRVRYDWKACALQYIDLLCRPE